MGVAGLDRTPVGLVRGELLADVDASGVAGKAGEDRSRVGDFLGVDSTRGRVFARKEAVGAEKTVVVEGLRGGAWVGDRALELACEDCETCDSLLEDGEGDADRCSSVEGKGTATGGGELLSGEFGAESRPGVARGDEGEARPSRGRLRSASAEPGTASTSTSIEGLVITGGRSARGLRFGSGSGSGGVGVGVGSTATASSSASGVTGAGDGSAGFGFH